MMQGLTNRRFRPQAARAVLAALAMTAAGGVLAGVPLYDYRQPVRDGVILVGMECNRNTQSLELGIFEAGLPPTKRMDLWKTADLVSFDPKTYMVAEIRHVERNCKLGDTHYKVRFDGLPGAVNAMWMCGAVVTARASVWKNGRLIYEQELARCGVDDSVRLARFVPGSDVPTLVRNAQ